MIMIVKHKPIVVIAQQYLDPQNPPPQVLVVTRDTLYKVHQLTSDAHESFLSSIDSNLEAEKGESRLAFELSKLPPHAEIGTAWISSGVDGEFSIWMASYTKVEIGDWIIYQNNLREQIGFPVLLKARSVPIVMRPDKFNNYFEVQNEQPNPNW